jgi:hypothetical protein
MAGHMLCHYHICHCLPSYDYMMTFVRSSDYRRLLMASLNSARLCLLPLLPRLQTSLLYYWFFRCYVFVCVIIIINLWLAILYVGCTVDQLNCWCIDTTSTQLANRWILLPPHTPHHKMAHVLYNATTLTYYHCKRDK